MGKSLKQRYKEARLKLHDKRLVSEATKREKLKKKELILDAKLTREKELSTSKKKTQKIKDRISKKKGKKKKTGSKKPKESFQDKLARANKLFE